MRQNSASISSTLGSGPWYWHSLRFLDLGSAENSCTHLRLVSSNFCLQRSTALPGQAKDNFSSLVGVRLLQPCQYCAAALTDCKRTGKGKQTTKQCLRKIHCYVHHVQP